MSAALQVYYSSFDAAFYKLPPEVRTRIETQIDEMGRRPGRFPHHHLTGTNRYRLRAGDYRVIYQSKPFPAGSMVLAHDLDPSLAGKLRACTMSYAFSPQLEAAFQGADRYIPMNYQRDFDAVRQVANAAAVKSGGFDQKEKGK